MSCSLNLKLSVTCWLEVTSLYKRSSPWRNPFVVSLTGFLCSVLCWMFVPNINHIPTDLVKYIKKEHGDYFCISVAGYPEGEERILKVDYKMRSCCSIYHFVCWIAQQAATLIQWDKTSEELLLLLPYSIRKRSEMDEVTEREVKRWRDRKRSEVKTWRDRKRSEMDEVTEREVMGEK